MNYDLVEINWVFQSIEKAIARPELSLSFDLAEISELERHGNLLKREVLDALAEKGSPAQLILAGVSHAIPIEKLRFVHWSRLRLGLFDPGNCELRDWQSLHGATIFVIRGEADRAVSTVLSAIRDGKRGRPKLDHGAIRAEFKRQFPTGNKGRTPWKEVARRLSDVGIDASVDTIKRALGKKN